MTQDAAPGLVARVLALVREVLSAASDLRLAGTTRRPPSRRAVGQPEPAPEPELASEPAPQRGEPTVRERWARAQAILNAAVELPTAERAGFVAGECGSDASLRDEVESLLRSHESAGPLDRLASDVIAPLVAPLRSSSADLPRPLPRPPAAAATDPASPDATPNRYEILDLLGDGGMGVVYRGFDTRLRREVALKFLPPHLSTGAIARKRFLLEARAAAALDHPNICTVHEIGETEDGGLFIAMPLYEGETLDGRLARGAFHWEEALEITLQVADGLARAHGARIIHRDIKPANLCVTAEGIVKILDFGIAKVADDALTGADLIVGTAAYMSPEQARGEDLDHRSDIWSLGAVLYEMLTGERLFQASDPAVVLAALSSSGPMPLGRLRGTAPAPLIRVVEQMLAREPEERPPSANAVITLLRDAATARADGAGAAASAMVLAPEGERRQATVMVVSVVDYATMLEQIAPAELRARLGRLRSAIDDIVRRHDGTLNEFTGDRIVAVFGVPITHEDDTLRAARAALDLHGSTRLGGETADEEAMALRCGVATGTLVAQRADEAERAYHLAGEPPQLAAVLAEQASAGETLLDASTERTARAHFIVQPRGALPGEPDGREAGVFALIGEAGTAAGTRVAVAEPVRLTTFTGRERELQTLLSLYEHAVTGEGQVVTVVGEAGAGKSRLIHEFRRRVEADGARIVHGPCEAYAGTRPYLPFVEVLRELLGGSGEPARATEARVITALRETDARLEPYTAFYLHLLSVPTERNVLPRNLQGEQFRAAMREALTALITVVCERAPLVLVFEDWHWVDEASNEVLKQLAEIVATYPLLVVVSYRPGYGAEWESSQPHALIHLSPLGVADCTNMVAAMLRVTEPPHAVAAALHERAGGNPFFLEELCQSLQEAGMLRVENGRAALSGSPEALHLPTTIQGVLRTRLDRLPAGVREVVRSAAVVGRDFTLPLLLRLGHDRYALDQALQTLKQLGIVQQTRVVPERAFRFKHVLTREVAYDTVLQHQRKVVHRRVGDAIEELSASALDEQAARLAHHYSRAEVWSKAVQYGQASARRAQGLSEFTDALATLEAVAEWLARLPDATARRELEVETLLQQEEICETLGRRGRQQELLDRLSELVDAGFDRRRLIEVYRRRGDVYTLLQRFEEARAMLDAALELARANGDEAAQAHVLRSLGLTGWHEGRVDEALGYIEEALRLDRRRGDDDAATADLNNKAQILKDQGQHHAALECLQHALELLDAAPNDLKKSYVLHNMGNIHRALGDLDTALTYLTQAGELASRRHLPVQRAFHLTAIANIHLTRGRIDDAVTTYEEAVAVARRARYAEGLAHSLRPLGELLAGMRRFAEALPYLEEAAELFGQLGNRDREADVWRATAETAERAGEMVKARESWTRYLTLAEQIDDTDARLVALEGMARAHRALGSAAAARDALTNALELARRSRQARREAALLNSLGILEWEGGGYERALAWYDAALATFRELGDDVHAGVILNSLGATLKALSRYAESRTHFEQALATNRATGQRLLEGHSLAALAELCLEAGELRRAGELAEASLAIRRAIGDRSGEAWMNQLLARVRSRQGRETEARAHRETARALAAELDEPKLIEACAEVPA